MTSTGLMFLEFYGSLLSFSVIAGLYVVPAMRRLPFRQAITPILLLHSFRHMGLVYLVPQVVPELPPEQFSVPTAWGDVLSAGLALVALAAVRLRSRLAVATAWVFNVVGVLDLMLAAYQSSVVDFMKYEIGPAYFLPVIIVPALLVTHALAFWLLVRRHGPTEG